jgi:ATP-dependent exoDNAse (exonuclease V) beta subunit
VADEIARILYEDDIRDKQTGLVRRARPGDIAVLFRSRTSHREFEQELAARRIPTYVYKGLGFFDSDEIKDASALLRYLAQPRSNLRAAAFLRSRFVRVSDPGLAALAPQIADAITAETADWRALDDEDQRVLAHVRKTVPRWLALVDRIPPADLFEQILAESAYAYEIRGRRRPQAWENLKKMRGLVRRVQNRGYATLPRIADHIDALSAGDESNAVLEAIDAVNLMTVHAAKGLEFPVVFVVNMARGAGGLPRPVRIIADADDREPSVSVSPFVSEADEIEREREQHETRRLLYVAMTRARDRLYFSATLKDGVLQAGRGGLADVLPVSIKELFAAAATSADTVIAWKSASQRQFKWRVCRLQPATVAPEVGEADAAGPATVVNFDAGVARLEVSDRLHRQSAPMSSGEELPQSEIMVGRLVHRLFQFPPGPDAVAHVRGLMRSTERGSLPNAAAVIESALEIWGEMRHRSDVAAILDGAEVLTEVPFSTFEELSGRTEIVRGTIDCLAIAPDGTVTVLEYKTGRARPGHEQQLEVYVRAARTLFPTASVRGQLIYRAPQ